MPSRVGALWYLSGLDLTWALSFFSGAGEGLARATDRQSGGGIIWRDNLAAPLALTLHPRFLSRKQHATNLGLRR